MWHSVQDIESSVCRIICGVEDDDEVDKGTAFLIAKNRVLTATHNINRYLNDKSTPIILEFLNLHSEPEKRKAIPISSENKAVIILEFEENIEKAYLQFSDCDINPDEDFETYGYPVIKWSHGQWIKNKVSRVIGNEVFNPYDWNIDLNHQTPIKDFSGLSGSPLIVGGKLAGVLLTESLEQGNAISLGAIGSSNFFDLLKEKEIHVHESVDPYLHEVDENQYKDFIFVEKLEAAQISLHEICQTEFYHAEILSNMVKSKDINNEKRELQRIRNNVRSYWFTKYQSYTDEEHGSLLLSSVYEQIEKYSETDLKSPTLDASLYAKKGMLHQWAEECKVGWVKNYESNLVEFRKKREGTPDESSSS